MTKKIGIIMDPLSQINYKKDSTLAMIKEGQRRNYDIYYILQSNLYFKDEARTRCQQFSFIENPDGWYRLGEIIDEPLTYFDIILMRKDPPVDDVYINTTYLLEHAERAGVLIVNKPQSLRDINEKIITTRFPSLTPPTLITSNMDLLRAFYEEFHDIVCKPTNGMGGVSIFRLKPDDQNASGIFETLTKYGTTPIVAQRYLAEIVDGDKRILLIDGKPIPFALARIPKAGEFRGNLAAGGRGIARPLSVRDKEIAHEVGDYLRTKGIYFAGIDVIGDCLTEVNVTSPTCIRELDQQCDINISANLWDVLESHVDRRSFKSI